MAAVALTRAVLSLASDPSVSLAFYTSSRSDQRSKPGEVRRRANGRLQAVSQVGRRQVLGVTARNLTPAQVDTLESWAGVPVLFRDAWGRKTYGVFFAISPSDYADRSGHDVQFTLEQVSFSEAV